MNKKNEIDFVLQQENKGGNAFDDNGNTLYYINKHNVLMISWSKWTNKEGQTFFSVVDKKHEIKNLLNLTPESKSLKVEGDTETRNGIVFQFYVRVSLSNSDNLTGWYAPAGEVVVKGIQLSTTTTKKSK